MICKPCRLTTSALMVCSRVCRWGIKLATDAAVTVLKVDQIIMAKQAGGPKAPPTGQGDDDD